MSSPESPQADPLSEVREAALALLSRREHSRRELARKLRRKGYSRDQIESVLGRLEEVGLVSDERYARLFVMDKLAVRPLGRRRIVQGLRRKGVEGELADRAIDAVYHDREVDDRTLAETLARKRAERLVGLDAAVARRRLSGFLARRGFDAAVVVETVRRVLDDLMTDTADPLAARRLLRDPDASDSNVVSSGPDGSDAGD